MGFAVEMYFDATTEGAIRELWEELAEHKVTSVLIEIGARPHVSLAVFEALDPEALRPMLEAFAAQVQPFTVTLSAYGSFPTEVGVVFLAPAPTQMMLEVHANLHRRLKTFGVPPIEYYRPGNWVPHCTVAMDLTSPQVISALAVCQRSSRTLAGRFEGIGLVEFRPVKQLYSRRFHATGAG